MAEPVITKLPNGYRWEGSADGKFHYAISHPSGVAPDTGKDILAFGYCRTCDSFRCAGAVAALKLLGYDVSHAYAGDGRDDKRNAPAAKGPKTVAYDRKDGEPLVVPRAPHPKTTAHHSPEMAQMAVDFDAAEQSARKAPSRVVQVTNPPVNLNAPDEEDGFLEPPKTKGRRKSPPPAPAPADDAEEEEEEILPLGVDSLTLGLFDSASASAGKSSKVNQHAKARHARMKRGRS